MKLMKNLLEYVRILQVPQPRQIQKKPALIKDKLSVNKYYFVFAKHKIRWDV